MRFISKSSNLLIVLRPGMSAQPLTGTPAKGTVSVRFKEGVADVPDGEMVEMMLRHPGYEGDFISADTVNNVDPYAFSRQESEPQHVVTEMKFGSPVSRRVEGGKQKLPPELAKIVQDMAVGLAKEMLPSMLESALKGLVKAHEEDKVAAASISASTIKPKGKRGRKPGSGKKSLIQPSEISVPSITENPQLQHEVA